MTSVCTDSRKVNNVATLHSELVQIAVLKDLVDSYGVSRNATNSNEYHTLDAFLLLIILSSHSSSVAGPASSSPR
ncbi:hypothetical protein EDB19DRAFT_1673265 [Suillus lakei]|nr:hypothetical protein EDB19DRAFT_1673265 [Suillus lakei]